MVTKTKSTDSETTGENIIKLVLGDCSGDGYEKTEAIIIKSSHAEDDLNKFYKRGVKKIGFDLAKDVCTEYEDNSISAKHIAMLKAAGYKTEIETNNNSDDPDWDCEVCECNPCECVGEEKLENNNSGSLYSQDYFDVYLFFLEVGSGGTFKYEEVPDNTSRIDIGGYGLLM